MSKIILLISGYLQESGLSGAVLTLFTSVLSAVVFVLLPIIVGTIVDKVFILFCRPVAKLLHKDLNRVAAVISYMTFPGVMMHELSHAFAVWVLGGHIVKIRLLEITASGRMGQVVFQPRGTKFMQRLQYAATACAPVISGFILIWVFTAAGIGFSTPKMALCLYLAVCAASHMSMSGQDVKSYMKGVVVFFLIFFAVSYYIVTFKL